MRRYSRRAFPPYRHEPGKTPHPERDPAGHMFGASDVLGADDFAYGVDLFNAGFYWEAHVYLERLWRAATEDGDERSATFLQGLIQLSAACVKRRLGQPGGVRKLVAKSLDKLQASREHGPACMSVPLDPILEAISKGEVPVIQISS